MNIKKMLQAPLRSRQTARYEARIKEQTVRYHDWILRKEEKERSGRVLEGTGIFVKCVPSGACRATFQVPEGDQNVQYYVYSNYELKPAVAIREITVEECESPFK